ncbi:mannose-1-phosphate guanylyltransferase/mannose-6-phosphate isomerase [Zymobacter palmae]|uniref:mannose-1-phosphate guanylyltransferase n=1 Tax=Zymobacter palmae TaxID=33074 RepID=A0A348HHC4_9GAMM|nr:mannose-1-phosphate guanylyltransferase/mannose-6-phosphate isomerase [Zymobacter palmae]BBG31026.1 mannose-1-phosphate guanylyltransferase [Zymobacter palmae]
MTTTSLYPIILAGGTGSLLWPLSRAQHPKQFLCLDGQYTMLQDAVRRLDGLQHKAPIIVCNEQYRFIVADQLLQLPSQAYDILLEPARRNTAPSIALAAFDALRREPEGDPLLLVLAADHVIRDTAAFQRSVQHAIPLAEAGRLVTFGTVPERPETGYGYIRRGKPLSEPDAFDVDRFVEKPDSTDAEAYVSSGDYYWNSGMFLFRARRYLEALQTHRPDIYEACETAMQSLTQGEDFERVDSDAFKQCPAESIDYAVMEQTSDAAVVAMDAGWSDVGSWDSLWDIKPHDANGNATHGDVISFDTHDSYIRSESALVATLGVKDLIVVQTKDAVLIADRHHAQDVRKVVAELERTGRREQETQLEVFRPWGKYASIDEGKRYLVKRITVKPGAQLSLQMHHHRAEHWIVVTGTARVVLENESHLLSENESIYIPLGQTHRLENPGKIPLELIEVSSGAYIGEDDIVRFEDHYGRTSR